MPERDFAGAGAGLNATNQLFNASGPTKFREVIKSIGTSVIGLVAAFATLATKSETNLKKIETRLDSILAKTKAVNTALAGTGMASAAATSLNGGAPMAGMANANLTGAWGAPTGAFNPMINTPQGFFTAEEMGIMGGVTTFGQMGGNGNGGFNTSGGITSGSAGSAQAGSASFNAAMAAAGTGVAVTGAVTRYVNAMGERGGSAYALRAAIASQTGMGLDRALQYGTGTTFAGAQNAQDALQAFQTLNGPGLRPASQTYNALMRSTGAQTLIQNTLGLNTDLTSNAAQSSWLINSPQAAQLRMRFGMSARPNSGTTQFTYATAAERAAGATNYTAQQISSLGTGTAFYKNLYSAANGNMNVLQGEQNYLEQVANARARGQKGPITLGAQGESAVQTAQAERNLGYLGTRNDVNPYATQQQANQVGMAATGNIGIGTAQAQAQINLYKAQVERTAVSGLTPAQQRDAGQAAAYSNAVISHLEGIKNAIETVGLLFMGEKGLGGVLGALRGLKGVGGGRAGSKIGDATADAEAGGETVGEGAAGIGMAGLAIPAAIVGGSYVAAKGLVHVAPGVFSNQAINSDPGKIWRGITGLFGHHKKQQKQQNSGVGGKGQAMARSGGQSGVPGAKKATTTATHTGAQIVADAQKEIGVPYVWAGSNPATGFDCSGLTQYVYGENGIKLPHLAAAQAKLGTPVKSIAEAQQGDLVFYGGNGYDGSPGDPGHVGIYIGNGKMIDAPYTGVDVRVDNVGSPVAIRRFVKGGPGSPTQMSSGAGGSGLLLKLGGGGGGNTGGGGGFGFAIGEGTTGTESASLIAGLTPSFQNGASQGGGILAIAAGTGSPKGSAPGTGTGITVGGNVKSWVAQAEKIAKVNSSWTTGLETIIEHESGGNPKAINLSDSNAAAGHPSQGLMQTIPSTFHAYAVAPWNKNIDDPVSNIVAGIRYIESRYGGINNVPGIRSLASGGPYVGYEVGSMDVQETGPATLHKGEMVIRAGAAGAMRMNQLSGGQDGGISVVFEKGAIQVNWTGTSTTGGPTVADTDAWADQMAKSIEKKLNMRKLMSA